MKNIKLYILLPVAFFALFFIVPKKAFAGEFGGFTVKTEVKYLDGNISPLNDIRINVSSDTNASYYGGGVQRSCASVSSTYPAGPFVNLNGTDTYYSRLNGLKTGGSYSYGSQTYNNPDGTLYYGNGASSTNGGGGMGFGFGACKCSPAIFQAVDSPTIGGYKGHWISTVYSADSSSGENPVNVSWKNGSSVQITFSYILENDAPSVTYDHPLNGTDFSETVDGETVVNIGGKVTDPNGNSVAVKFYFGQGQFSSGNSPMTGYVASGQLANASIIFKELADGTARWRWGWGSAADQAWRTIDYDGNGTADKLHGGDFYWNIIPYDSIGATGTYAHTNNGGVTRRFQFPNRVPDVSFILPVKVNVDKSITVKAIGSDADNDKVKVRIQRETVAGNGIYGDIADCGFDASYQPQPYTKTCSTTGALAVGTYKLKATVQDIHGAQDVASSSVIIPSVVVNNPTITINKKQVTGNTNGPLAWGKTWSYRVYEITDGGGVILKASPSITLDTDESKGSVSVDVTKGKVYRVAEIADGSWQEYVYDGAAYISGTATANFTVNDDAQVYFMNKKLSVLTITKNQVKSSSDNTAFNVPSGTNTWTFNVNGVNKTINIAQGQNSGSTTITLPAGVTYVVKETGKAGWETAEDTKNVYVGNVDTGITFKNNPKAMECTVSGVPQKGQIPLTVDLLASVTNPVNALISAFNWDLDGNGSFETTSQPGEGGGSQETSKITKVFTKITTVKVSVSTTGNLDEGCPASITISPDDWSDENPGEVAP